jgi:Na+-driven multidrug efflux pump
MLFIMIEWSAFNINIMLCGLLDLNSLAAQIVMYQYTCLMCSVPRGIQAAQCTIVGNRLGERDVPTARRFNFHLNLFSAVVCAVVIIGVSTTIDEVWALFTDKAGLTQARIDVWLYLMIYFALDHG